MRLAIPFRATPVTLEHDRLQRQAPFCDNPLVRSAFGQRTDRPSLRKDCGGVAVDESAIPQETQCDRGIAIPVSRWGGFISVRVTKYQNLKEKNHLK